MLIVSLTSYPRRIQFVSQAVCSILRNTFKPDWIVLWLALEEFPNKEKDLPPSLLALREQGLAIMWCSNILSYKKLIPSLKFFTDDNIFITIDDDTIYPKDFIGLLYQSYKKMPNKIHTFRGRRLRINNGEFIDYKDTEKLYNPRCKLKPSYNHLFTGVGGVLYPPKSLLNDVLDEKIFMRELPSCDDIWFWAMCVLNKKKINVVPYGKSYKQNKFSLTKLFHSKSTNTNSPGFREEFKTIDGTAESSLYKVNIHGGLNDSALSNILKLYPEILDSFRDEVFLMKPMEINAAKSSL